MDENQNQGGGDAPVSDPTAAPTDQPVEQKCVTCGSTSSGGTCVACGQGEVTCTCNPAGGNPSAEGGEPAPAV